MILTIDIGNTNTSIGIFDNDKLVETYRISSDILKTEDEYGIFLLNVLNFKNFKLKGAIISSVVPNLSETFKSAVMKYLNICPISLSYKSKMPINISLDNNSEIGADRIANATGAIIKYKAPIIVIDFGTATTFDIVDENKNFIGGIIAPGLEIQAKALSKYTSKLPKLKIEAPKNAIGKNTIDAMLSGIVHGHICMIKGMIEKCSKELNKKPTIVATGGISKIISKDCNDFIDHIDNDLTLFGLKELYYLNKE